MEKLRSEIENKYKWDLTKVFKEKSEYQNACALVKNLTNKIVGMKGSITASSDNLFCYLTTEEELSQLLEKIYVYSYLYHYEDMNDEVGLEYKNTADKLNDDVTVALAFTSSELLNAGYKKIQEFIKEDSRLQKYAFSLERTFRYESHVLSEAEENIIAEASVALGTPSEVFSSLDNVDIDLGFIKDENNQKFELNNSNYIKYMNNKNRKVRKSAFQNMYAFYGKHINTITSAYLGNIKEGFFSSKVRKFKNPLEQSLYSDKIEPEFYHNFINEIHEYLPLLYKYLRVRNKALGYKSHMYDIYVDLVSKKEKDIDYEEGKNIVLEALKPLGEKYVQDLSQAFTNGWIDVYHNKYKRSGAYQWGSYGTNPYVSLNYENNADSVSTLAHELGHAMHTFYSNASQDYTYANYPIFLAEIASTVNEVLIDDYFYKHAQNDDEKIIYLQSFLDKVRTTIFRQTMFAEFESIMHDKYEQQIPITSTLACNTYYDLNKLYFGKSVTIDEEIKYEWARIPHFYTPFYVYKYATGLIAALSIASDILNSVPNATENYLKFLSAGSSDYPLEILKKTGVDITDPKVIRKAFKLFSEKLELLEELVTKKVNTNE